MNCISPVYSYNIDKFITTLPKKTEIDDLRRSRAGGSSVT